MIQRANYFIGICFTVLCLLPTKASYAQFYDLSFQHLTQDEGLSQSFNSFIFKDSRGFIWISSIEGLNRYDGQNIRVFYHNAEDPHSVSGNIINSPFFEDADHNIWFAAYNGINCYLRQKDHFQSFQLKDSSGQVIKEDYHAFHLDEQGWLWVRTGIEQKGRLHLFNIHTQEDRIVMPLNGHRFVVRKNEQGEVNEIIAAMMPSGDGIEIYRVNKQQLEEKTSFLRVPSKKHLHITHVFPESDSLYWLSMDGGLGAYNPITQQLKTYAPDIEGGIVKVWHSLPYGEDFLFVSSIRTGIWLFDKNRRSFVQQFKREENSENGLKRNFIYELQLDDQANLWASIWGFGIAHTNLQKIKFNTLLRRQDDQGVQGVYSICEDAESNVWCGTNRGIYVFDQQKRIIEHFTRAKSEQTPLPSRTVFFLGRFNDNHIFGGLGNQLYRLSLRPKRVEPVLDFPGRIHHALSLKDQRILIATEEGVWMMQQQDNDYTAALAPGFSQSANRSFTALYEDRRGQLYVSENGVSIKVYHSVADSFQLQAVINDVGYCKAFYEPEDRDSLIWIGTSNGLLSLHKYTLTTHLLTEKEGIPSETYYSVLPQGQALWLSSNNGILKYDSEKQQHRRYTMLDGIQGHEFNTNAYLLKNDGEIWLGGTYGINVFYPDEIQDLPFPPQIEFTQINIDDEPDTIPIAQRELDPIDLPYEQNTLSFEFVGMDYSNVDAVQFQYRMLGYDRNWVLETRRGFARYPNLPPGDYTFQVKAANSDGVWTENSKDLRIHIQTPFWQSWWFYLACLIIGSALIYTWFRYRLEQALKIERMRVKISSDLHDDVGTLLSGLAMQSELLELTATSSDKPQLKRISEMSRNAMSRMRDTVWAIDARKDKFENLLDRMREHAEETLTAKDIHFLINTDGLNLKTNLPSHIRQNIYLIYKEAITNIAKHSNADQVRITLRQYGRAFHMSIHDNGQVKAKAYKTTGLGSENMQMRAEQLGGQLTVKKEQGYEVVLNIADLE